MSAHANGLKPGLPAPQIQAGLVHAPSTHSSAEELQKLLHRDYLKHHCFFNDLGFHNHLPHHLVAAYDMGAPPELLRAIYEDEVKVLRPLNRTGEDIRKAIGLRDWESTTYASYLTFFSDRITQDGVPQTFHKYVMAPEANGNEALMFARFLAGALHPLLQVGFGAEFGQDYMVAAGLAMAAVTSPTQTRVVLDASGLPELSNSQVEGATLLSLLREVYDSSQLTPILPYDPDALRKNAYGKPPFLLAATGKPNRAPRFDFFLMHVLTSSLCIPSLLKIIPGPVQKAQLLQGYARASALIVLLRGRPRIDIPLLMSYSQHQLPPTTAPAPRDTVGDPRVAEQVNAWLALSVRAMYYAAQRYGSKGPGEAIGVRNEKGEETHKGALNMDGTIFVRAAGAMTNALGWVAYGSKEGNWDRSALGWDAAWDNED
ncbi:hypothetical protein C8J57DRAFT_1295466 [Mycena rebaudengoi]|nr:hypothetical protein C8J57DRAFT_1295466 [Mycena rebaudengoi]